METFILGESDRLRFHRAGVISTDTRRWRDGTRDEGEKTGLYEKVRYGYTHLLKF